MHSKIVNIIDYYYQLLYVFLGHASNHWLGALGTDDTKCIEWVNGRCIEEEDTDHNSSITDLWRAGQPGDTASSNFALLLQIEHENPFTLVKTTEKSYIDVSIDQIFNSKELLNKTTNPNRVGPKFNTSGLV